MDREREYGGRAIWQGTERNLTLKTFETVQVLQIRAGQGFQSLQFGTDQSHQPLTLQESTACAVLQQQMRRTLHGGDGILIGVAAGCLDHTSGRFYTLGSNLVRWVRLRPVYADGEQTAVQRAAAVAAGARLGYRPHPDCTAVQVGDATLAPALVQQVGRAASADLDLITAISRISVRWEGDHAPELGHNAYPNSAIWWLHTVPCSSFMSPLYTVMRGMYVAPMTLPALEPGAAIADADPEEDLWQQQQPLWRQPRAPRHQPRKPPAVFVHVQGPARAQRPPRR
jgi:hypothetical protein